VPVIGISVERLMGLVRRGAETRVDVTPEHIETLLDQLGCDVDGVADVRRYRSRHSDYVLELKPQETIPLTDPHSGVSGERWEDIWELASTERQVLLELLPVRPDIFDAGGLARALRGYLGIETGLRNYGSGGDGSSPISTSNDGRQAAAPTQETQTWTVNVDPRITDPKYGRPHVQCAIVHDLAIDDDLLRAIMKLQENIHWALCRDRKFASIGAYDLASLTGPISYTLVDPDSFRFVPLFWGGREPVSPAAMLAEHPKGMAYAHLLEGLDAYPALLAANGKVLALPPVINADETKVTTATRDIFLDVTGPNLPIVEKALAVMGTSLVELDLHGRAWIEPVTIARPDGQLTTPRLDSERFSVSPARAARLLGLDLDLDDCAELLRRMRHDAVADGADAAGPLLRVDVPAYRTDIMHEVDLIEDIAIAYGYHRIVPELVPTFTAGARLPLNDRARAAAAALTGLGYTETLSLVLTNERDHYERLKLQPFPPPVTVANPASSDQTMLRQHLWSSLLEQLALNTDHPLPQKIFEVGVVVGPNLAAPEANAEPTELRMVAAAFIGQGAGYAAGRSVMDALLHEMGYAHAEYRPSDRPTAIPGRAASVVLTGTGLPFGMDALASRTTGDVHMGQLFEVHPEVLEEWKLSAPVVMLSLVLGVEDWG
jgi:phenylalanyl-tRNA synthetase beta chain